MPIFKLSNLSLSLYLRTDERARVYTVTTRGALAALRGEMTANVSVHVKVDASVQGKVKVIRLEGAWLTSRMLRTISA